MNKLTELTDFSMYDGVLPCAVCGSDSLKTLMGNHWKCTVCAHIFNQDGSDTKVQCICDKCRVEAEEAAVAEKPVDEKSIKGVLKKIKSKVKKLSKKKKAV